MNIEGNIYKEGNVRIFQYDQSKSDWLQMENQIDYILGNTIRDLSSTGDGKTMVIAESKYRSNEMIEGRIRMIKYDEEKKTWIESDDHFVGDSIYRAGYSVAISSDGTILASGETLINKNDTSVVVQTRFYEKNKQSNEWVQRRQKIMIV